LGQRGNVSPSNDEGDPPLIMCSPKAESSFLISASSIPKSEYPLKLNVGGHGPVLANTNDVGKLIAAKNRLKCFLPRDKIIVCYQ